MVNRAKRVLYTCRLPPSSLFRINRKWSWLCTESCPENVTAKRLTSVLRTRGRVFEDLREGLIGTSMDYEDLKTLNLTGELSTEEKRRTMISKGGGEKCNRSETWDEQLKNLRMEWGVRELRKSEWTGSSFISTIHYIMLGQS
ncbi:hypothetical protein FF2_039985 [Malus domestica]